MAQDLFGRPVDINNEDLIKGMSSAVKSGDKEVSQGLSKLIELSNSYKKSLEELAKVASASPEDGKQIKEIVKLIRSQSKNKEKNTQKSFESALLTNSKKTDLWSKRMKMIDKFMHEAVTGHSLHVHDYTAVKILEDISKNINLLSKTLQQSISNMGPGKGSGSGGKTNADYFNEAANAYDSQSSEHLQEMSDWMEQNGADTTEIQKSLMESSEDIRNISSHSERFLGEIQESMQYSLNNSYHNLRLTKNQIKNLKNYFMSDHKLSVDQLDLIDQHLTSVRRMNESEKDVLKDQLEKIELAVREGNEQKAHKLSEGLVGQASRFKGMDEGSIARLEHGISQFNNKFRDMSTLLNAIKPANLGLGNPVDLIKSADVMREFSSRLDTQLNANHYTTTGLRGSLNPNEKTKTQAGSASSGYYGNLNSLVGRNSFLDTGVSRDDILKISDTYNDNLTRGIKLQKQLYNVTRAGLGVATLIGASVEETADMFAEWSQHLDLSGDQLYLLSNTLTDVARKTGLSGKNLMQVAQNSKQFAESMRNAGTFSDEALKNVMLISAEAKKKGVEGQANKINEILSDPTKLFEADSGTQNLVNMIAAQSGTRDQLMSGTLLEDPEALNRFSTAMEKFTSQFKGLSGKELQARSMGIKEAYGMSIPELIRVAGSFKEGSSTTQEKMDKMKKELENQRLTNDERSDLTNQMAILNEQMKLDSSSKGKNALVEMSKLLKENADMTMEQAMTKFGGKKGVMDQVSNMKKALEEADLSKMNADEKEQRNKVLNMLSGLNTTDAGEFRNQVSELIKEFQKTQIAEKNLGTSKIAETNTIQEQRTDRFQGEVLKALEKIKGWGDATTFANVNYAAGVAANLTTMLERLTHILTALTVIQGLGLLKGGGGVGGLLGGAGAGAGAGKSGIFGKVATLAARAGVAAGIEYGGGAVIEQMRESNRITSQTADTLNDIKTWAAIGVVLGGPIGAAVGTAVGGSIAMGKGIVAISDVQKEIEENNKRYEANKGNRLSAIKEGRNKIYSEDLSKMSDIGQRYNDAKKNADNAKAKAKSLESSWRFLDMIETDEYLDAKESMDATAKILENKSGDINAFRETYAKAFMENIPKELSGKEDILKPLVADYVEKLLEDQLFGKSAGKNADPGTEFRLQKAAEFIKTKTGFDIEKQRGEMLNANSEKKVAMDANKISERLSDAEIMKVATNIGTTAATGKLQDVDVSGAGGVSDWKSVVKMRGLEDLPVSGADQVQIDSLEDIGKNTAMSADEIKKLRMFLENMMKESNAGSSAQANNSTTNSRQGAPAYYHNWGGGIGQNANWGPPNPSPIGTI